MVKLASTLKTATVYNTYKTNMKIEAIKDIIIYIEGKSFIFSYEELASLYLSLEEETVIIRIKPNENEIPEGDE
jgi:hypothetical protein